MPDTNLLATWIDQANIRMSKTEEKHDKLQISHTRLEAQVNTRNKIIFALVGILFGAISVVIGLITFLDKHPPA